MTVKDSLSVTVLMPVYNAAPYLAEAIESILNQTYTDFEFLIINDGSTDNSRDIIKSYTDKRIRLIDNPQNIRLIATLNIGIELSKGKYIARMDADDISLPERLEKQVLFMEKHQEIGLCGSFIRTHGLENNYDVHYCTLHDEIKFKLFFDTHFPHPAAIIKKSVLTENNLFFKKEYIHAEDFALWNKMADYTKLAIIPEVLVLKRCHEDQISTKFTHTQHVISSKIRKELIEKMGLITDDEEIKAYDNFYLQEKTKNKSELLTLLKLFDKFIVANRKAKAYKAELFESYFAQKYWDLCCTNTHFGMDIYNLYLKSEVKHILNKSYSVMFKFFVKSLLKQKRAIKGV